MAIVAPISGTLSDRIGSRVLSTFGMGIMAAGLYLLSRISVGTPVGQVILSLAVVGFGTGMFISPNTSALMSSAPRNRQGIASGVLATARNVGMVLGVGLAGAIFSTIAGRQAASNVSLYQGISTSFLVAAGIGVVGMVVSAIRGEKVSVLEKAPRG
jgi:MFS family permease